MEVDGGSQNEIDERRRKLEDMETALQLYGSPDDFKKRREKNAKTEKYRYQDLEAPMSGNQAAMSVPTDFLQHGAQQGHL